MKQGDPKLFLEESFGEYSKLMEQSSILYKNIHKDLLTINEYFPNIKTISSNNSTSSSDSYSSNDDNTTEYKNIIITNSFGL
jgi:hypothetical protein